MKIIPKKDPLTTAFLAILLSIYAICLMLPLNWPIQDNVMAKFHLAHRSFTHWAMWQPIPSMYSFKNTITTSGTKEFVVNHYPLRVITFSLQFRDKILSGRQVQHVVLKSRFRKHFSQTHYRIAPADGTLTIEKEP